MINNSGKLIVIDGTDGSGKATQTRLLAERLISQGFRIEIADFPQYGQKSAGLVEEYLNGNFGLSEEVGPYRASLFFACDRYAASFRIRQWLNEGKIVIANRYVSANMAHQGEKIADYYDRQNFFDWLYKLEYGLFKIPKPDLSIILHIDAEIGQKLVDEKASRDYLSNGAKRDIHENDLNHLQQAEKVYLEIASAFPDFTLIECMRNGRIMTRQEINDLIWQEVIKELTSKQSSKNFAPNFIDLHNRQSGSRRLTIELLSPVAKLPTRAYQKDAGLDLYSADYYSLMPGERIVIKTGIRIAIAEGYVGLIWDKGGVAKQGVHSLAGVVDSGFRGEVTVNLVNLSQDIYNIAPGQKVAQLLIQKVEQPEIVEGKISDETDRGDNHFGSSGMY